MRNEATPPSLCCLYVMGAGPPFRRKSESPPCRKVRDKGGAPTGSTAFRLTYCGGERQGLGTLGVRIWGRLPNDAIFGGAPPLSRFVRQGGGVGTLLDYVRVPEFFDDGTWHK